MHLALTACLAAAIAAVATRAAIPWLTRWGAVARENARTLHNGTVAKGGGIALLASAFLALAVWTPLPDAAPTWMMIGLGTAVLAVLSLWDDFGHVRATVRLPLHIAVAALLVSGVAPDVSLFQGWLPFWADRAFGVLALAWMMNLYNFMDGINGIAGSETISISGGYIAAGAVTGIALPYAPLAAALAGASAGFLVWNARERSLVFLGDAGSVPLGFLVGVLMLDLAQRGLWAAALILPAYFFADATWTLAMRVRRGERLWEAHRRHAYQRAALSLKRHFPVVARVTVANVALVAAAVLSTSRPAAGIGLAALIVAILLFNLTAIGRSRSSGSDPSRR